MINSYKPIEWAPNFPYAWYEAYQSNPLDFWVTYYYHAVMMYGHTWNTSTKKRTYGGSVTAGHGRKYAKGSNGKYFGTLGHDALEVYYETGEFPFSGNVEAYKGATQFHLARMQYEDGVFIHTTEEDIEESCRLVIHTLQSVNNTLTGEVIATEQRFSSKIHKNAKGFKLYGKTDLMLYTPKLYEYGIPGGLVVVDYKFAKTENKKEWSEQVSDYIKLIREHYQGKKLTTKAGYQLDPALELASAVIVWVRSHKKTKKTMIDFIFYDASGNIVTRKELR